MSLCVVHFSVSVVSVCVCLVIHVLFMPNVSMFLSLGSCLPFLFFIPVSFSDGRSSSKAVQEEKEAPPLDPTQSCKGRFQVGGIILIFSMPISLKPQCNLDS